jgi:hypothetical protein
MVDNVRCYINYPYGWLFHILHEKIIWVVHLDITLSLHIVDIELDYILTIYGQCIALLHY